MKQNILIVDDDKDICLTLSKILTSKGYSVSIANNISSSNQSIYIPKGSKHSLENKYKEDLIIIEVWYGENLSEEDIVRYEDIYGRV